MQITEYIGYGTLSLGFFQVLSFLMGDAAPTGKFSGVSRFSMSVGYPVWLAWWTMEQPSVLVPVVALVSYFSSPEAVMHPGVVYLCGMFIIHYVQRSFIYPFCNNVGRDYPLHAWCFAMLFTALNGTMQSNDLLYGEAASRTWADGLYTPRVYLGFLIWAFGMFCNVQADTILRNLRPVKHTQGGATRGLAALAVPARHAPRVLAPCSAPTGPLFEPSSSVESLARRRSRIAST